jgi:HlyD family secretion protein
VGQTVAASFNTPTLFTIADDLSKMQVQASIDEADIGQILTGQKAHFTVDAYPNRQYTGTVSQKRLQPTTVQNVVTYTVMIDVDNPDLSLLPGMTANITVAVQQAHDVFKVPAAALKFAPPRAPGVNAGQAEVRVIPHRARVIGKMRKAVRIPPRPAKREQTAGDGRNPIPPPAIGGAEMAGPIQPAKKAPMELPGPMTGKIGAEYLFLKTGSRYEYRCGPA